MTVAVLGATGMAGQELVRLLLMRQFPMDRLRLFASQRSAGKKLKIDGTSYPLEELKRGCFRGVNLAFFATDASVSRQWLPVALKAGCTVLDKSSAFRMDPETPLVIPEINPEELHRHKGLVANPNCTTAVLLMGLAPLHFAFGLEALTVATYQSVSGAGQAMVRLYEQQLARFAQDGSWEVGSLVDNAVPAIDLLGKEGHTVEEEKLVRETRRILKLPLLPVAVTCVRIPVLRGHSMAVHARFSRPLEAATLRNALQSFPGLAVAEVPTPRDFIRRHDCGIGRLRLDPDEPQELSFWMTGDNLWRGASLNALLNAEYLHAHGLLPSRA